MTGQGRPPVFLVRRSYRRRRLGDAARLLPVLGLVLFALPAAGLGEGRGATQVVFLFLAWAALILAAGLVSRRLITEAAPPTDARPDGASGARDARPATAADRP